jgi:choline dehydrogenase-like flavoprotein
MVSLTKTDLIPEFDALIVGSGATGALIAYELACQGLSVVVLEAGQHFVGSNALGNSEANAGKIMWSEPRKFVGKDFIVPKTGQGVGGGTLPWLGVMPRFHQADFRTYTTEGVGVDWPIDYDDLRPHYEKVEEEFGIAGECGPHAPENYDLPMPPHRMNWHGQVLARGAEKLGAKPFAPPIAINSEERDKRPGCIYCGWCASGCPTEAKATAANTYLGVLIICEAFVYKVNYDSEQRRVTGVEYLDTDENEKRITAKLVILAAHAVETPRLLLLSANSDFPDGLANSSGVVGKYFMSHPTWQVFGTFDEKVNAFKGMQMGHVMVQDYYKPDPANDYARGYVLLSYMMTPATYGNLSGLIFGQELKDFIHDYAYTAAWWAHAEGLPDENNTITLDPELKDKHGLPVARVTYEWGENDVKLAAAARDKAVEMMEASGARKVRVGLNYGAHAMGSCRMGNDPKTSVVNSYGQSHDVKNLYICDTSVFVTGAGLNPTLTAMAIADRAGHHIIESGKRGEF